jgi:hypothetical protein
MLKTANWLNISVADLVTRDEDNKRRLCYKRLWRLMLIAKKTMFDYTHDFLHLTAEEPPD